ncbi:MAG: hypothetical protein EPO52_10620 [Herbiconiux sp.]|nr:MAG: hypothetical protein EPO52_10620 [Herbiconiux sp.]
MNNSVTMREDARTAIASGRTSLGIELGSTRIKACLIDSDTAQVLAEGGHDWENSLVDGVWTYELDDAVAGVRAAYADLASDAENRYGVTPRTLGSIGVSAMMHGYLAFDADDQLLVPFRTWRNTSTGPAAAELSELFGLNIPLRWSIAHLHQAVLDGESHVPSIRHITTLAGYLHWRLTGRRVLGVGDASGMFPIDSRTHDYDADLLARYDELVQPSVPGLGLAALLPEVLVAGRSAGELTADGAALLDPTGTVLPGIPLCPPEGDAGTGMVATCSVAPRTGNVSAGTSIFAMVVLERPLEHTHHELDLVTTPAGDPVAMVHCNNGASELGAWAGLFREFSAAAGTPIDSDTVFDALFRVSLEGAADAGGVLAYNHLAGEPIAGLTAGRPLVVRSPDSRFTLADFMRAQLYGVFGTLALGMRVLDSEGVRIDRMFAHGGLFRTAGVAQRFLAGALDAPVAVTETASAGGAWGIAVLGSYLEHAASGSTLGDFLRTRVFAGAEFSVSEPEPDDVAGFAAYLDRYRAGLAVESAAVDALPLESDTAAPVFDPEPELKEAIERIRKEVSDLHSQLTRYGLVQWTGGNISGRVPGADLFVIKPSGVDYDALAPHNMILCDLDGTVVPGTEGSDRSPSSDTAAHAYVYRQMPEVGGVVHTHSPYAVAWAARGEPIPCVTTAMADEFGGEVPIGPFAIIGDDSIGRGIVETLRGSRSRAVLMKNHGPFTVGKDARDAVKAAVMVEDVARSVLFSLQLGTPQPIAQENIDSLFNRYQNVYGQDPTGSLN